MGVDQLVFLTAAVLVMAGAVPAVTGEGERRVDGRGSVQATWTTMTTMTTISMMSMVVTPVAVMAVAVMMVAMLVVAVMLAAVMVIEDVVAVMVETVKVASVMVMLVMVMLVMVEVREVGAAGLVMVRPAASAATSAAGNTTSCR